MLESLRLVTASSVRFFSLSGLYFRPQRSFNSLGPPHVGLDIMLHHTWRVAEVIEWLLNLALKDSSDADKVQEDGWGL